MVEKDVQQGQEAGEEEGEEAPDGQVGGEAETLMDRELKLEAVEKAGDCECMEDI